MLSIMRRQAGSWIIKVILFAIVVVFVFWGVGSFRSKQANKVADINGQIVTYTDYRETYDRIREQYRRTYGNAFNDELLKSLNLEQQALDNIVNRVLMLQEAKRLDIQVADETVDDAILKIPAFQKNGVFDESQAKFVLSQNRMTTAEFRNSYKQDLILDKLRALIVDGVVVPEAEARDWYDWYNAEVDLNYFFFPASRYNDITLTDDEIADYFKANENDYRTDPKVKVNYLFFDPNTFKDQVEVTKEQIAEYYNGHPDEFKTEKTVEARHILLKLDADADEQTVADRHQEAMKIYEMAKAGKPFDELAKQYSEGPTREQGGYLGAFKKDAMVKPFADKAFAMKVGEISEPVRTRFGWHIIKVEKINAAHTQSLEDASAVIREKLVEEKARALALKKAETIYDSVFDGDDLSAAAKAHQLETRTTDFFTAKTLKEKGIGNPQLFADTAFGLETMAISDVLDLGNGYCLLQVVERIESAIPPLNTVVDKVRADLTEKREIERAKSDAQACLSELQKGKRLADAGLEHDVKPMATGFFKRAGAIPKIGYNPEMSKAAFMLTPEKAQPDQVFQGKQGWFVIQLKDRKPPAADGFEKEKKALTDRLTKEKQQSTIEQWLADLRARGTVDINYKLIQ